jgi:hypothetical protein
MNMRNSYRTRKIAIWLYVIGIILFSLLLYAILEHRYYGRISSVKYSVLFLFMGIIVGVWLFVIDQWIRKKLENIFNVTISNDGSWKIKEINLKTKYYLIRVLQPLLFFSFPLPFIFIIYWILFNLI